MAVTATAWALKGKGYEFCNCNPGCTCNFSGFPTSSDGSCKALVGNHILSGHCGDVDLSGVKAVALIDWPGPIHEGNGKVVFIVDPATTDEQIDALGKIYTGALGGNPWAILGSTYSVAGLVKAPVTFEGEGRTASLRVEGVGEGHGEPLRNPVTNEPNAVDIVLEHGFIWQRGICGVGSFSAKAEGIDLTYNDSNWIYYEFDWNNQS